MVIYAVLGIFVDTIMFLVAKSGLGERIGIGLDSLKLSSYEVLLDLCMNNFYLIFYTIYYWILNNTHIFIKSFFIIRLLIDFSSFANDWTLMRIIWIISII